MAFEVLWTGRLTSGILPPVYIKLDHAMRPVSAQVGNKEIAAAMFSVFERRQKLPNRIIVVLS